MIHKRIAAPTAELLSVDDVKAHLRIASSAEDSYLADLIADVRELAELETGRALGTQDWIAVLDAFPCGGIRLPAPPLQSLTSLTYVDDNGVTQPMDSSAWLLDDVSEPGFVFPAPDTVWPTTRCQPNAVRATVRCGYTAANLPGPLRRWMLVHIGHYYENREATGSDRIVALPYVSELLNGLRVIHLD